MSRTASLAIVYEPPRFYLARMVCLILRSLTMIAVLMLPFAMAAAPAAPADMTQASASLPSGHCPEQAGGDSPAVVAADCAMPCSAALAAFEVERFAPTLVAGRAGAPVCEPSLAGVLLEIATPPPKPA